MVTGERAFVMCFLKTKTNICTHMVPMCKQEDFRDKIDRASQKSSFFALFHPSPYLRINFSGARSVFVFYKI